MKKYLPFILIGGLLLYIMKSSKNPITTVDPDPSGPQTLRGARHDKA